MSESDKVSKSSGKKRSLVKPESEENKKRKDSEAKPYILVVRQIDEVMPMIWKIPKSEVTMDLKNLLKSASIDGADDAEEDTRTLLWLLHPRGDLRYMKESLLDGDYDDEDDEEIKNEDPADKEKRLHSTACKLFPEKSEGVFSHYLLQTGEARGRFHGIFEDAYFVSLPF